MPRSMAWYGYPSFSPRCGPYAFRIYAKCTTTLDHPPIFQVSQNTTQPRDLCQLTLDATAFIRSNSISPADTSIALLRRLAHQSVAAINRADIESIEKQDIRCRYAGKQAPRANRKWLTATTVMDGKGPMKLESEQQEKDLLQAVRSTGRGKKAKQR